MRIHIVAVSPRTGTTLMAECMAACFAIDGTEPHEAPITRLRLGRAIYLTKRPADLLAVWPRLKVDRAFYVICLMRDARDVIVSRHRQDRDRYWVPLRVWKRRLPEFRRLASHERVLTMRYEDFVRNPSATQRVIEERMPFLRRTRAFDDFHTAARPSSDSVAALGGLRRIGDGSVGAWHRHLPRVAGQLQQHGAITDELIEFGYERNASWLSALDGVTPDLSPSRLSDHTRGRWTRRLRHSRVVLPWLSARVVLAARAAGLTIA